MRPTDFLSAGFEDRSMERVEEILRSAADFQPETEANYNFAAAAMARRRFRSRLVLTAVAGCACTAVAVWIAVSSQVKPNLPSPLFPPSMNGFGVASTGELHAGPTGSSQHALVVSDGSDRASRVAPKSDRRRDASLVSDRGPAEDDSADVPTVKWETEKVDRYGSHIVKPTYVEERNADGSRTLTPALVTIPLDSGERPAVEGGSDMGMASLTSYDGEATK